MEEHFFQCPHCWQNISMLLDPSIAEQKYIEDCEICCKPIEIHIQFSYGKLITFNTSSVDQ